MSNVVLNVAKRNDDELKKNASRRLRASGFVPGTIYGLSNDPVNVKIDAKNFKDILKGRSVASLILDIHLKDDGKDKKEITLIKDIQRHPISKDFVHVDFIRIEMKKEVETSIPILILNEEDSVGIKEELGVLQHSLRELHIVCLPGDIPDKIEYDVIDLHMGESVKVSDVSIPDNVRVLSNPEEIVVSIIHPTHLVVEEPEEEEEEIEGEEAAEPELITKDKGEAEDKKAPEEKEEHQR